MGKSRNSRSANDREVKIHSPRGSRRENRYELLDEDESDDNREETTSEEEEEICTFVERE